MTTDALAAALTEIAGHLDRLGRGFALVGGLAVSLRSEVRFTRDVDLAVAVSSDRDTEQLIRELGMVGYQIAALVEQEATARIGTVRLRSPSGVVVDLLLATTGIEADIVSRASVLAFTGSGRLPTAAAEDLVAMKLLSMDDRRLQDRMDALALVEMNPQLDLDRVRQSLADIEAAGCARDQDLNAKLDDLLALAAT